VEDFTEQALFSTKESDLVDPEWFTCDGRKPPWFEPLTLYRFDLLIGPLDTTSLCDSLCESYWLHHSIQFSRFRCSERICYWSFISLSIAFSELSESN